MSPRTRRVVLTLPVPVLLAALLDLRAATNGETSVIPWTELTPGDSLTAITVRQRTVEGRTIHYPTPTRELATALEERSRSAATEVEKAAALRHLAEARRQLGDRPGAEAALEAWAGASGAAAWEEAARWGARHGSWPLAFRAAEKALSGKGLPEDAARSLATDRIGWAVQHPESGDALALQAARAARFPDDGRYVEGWIRALEAKGMLKEAESALDKAERLPRERRVLVAADLKAAHGQAKEAYRALEGEVVAALSSATPGPPVSNDLARAFATHAKAVALPELEALRKGLDDRFDRRALLLLVTFLDGSGNGARATELLRQVERRHEATFDRASWLLVARLWETLDAVPEAFRSTLAAASTATAADKQGDLASLAFLALKAGARGLPWGTYNDESYRWAARVDVTPGFATGGLSFLLTGFERDAALAELEGRRLPERTFETARLLVAELEKRNGRHPRLPSLAVALMRKHVERGEGEAALGLLPKADAGDAATRAESREVALLALRQTKAPIEREAGLIRERLRFLAPDGTVPPFGNRPGSGGDGADGERPTLRVATRNLYEAALRESIGRLDARDRSHRESASLLLSELDRLPAAEALWLYAAEQLTGWKLDDGLDVRYRAALDRFGDAGWWNRLARWYARARRSAELRALADDVVARFRGSALFARDPGGNLTIPVEGQPNPYIFLSDYLRLKALERFPASPRVLKEAEGRLVLLADYNRLNKGVRVTPKERGVVDATLLEARRNAVIFADSGHRTRFLDDLARAGRLEAFLLGLEGLEPKSPVELRLLVDGWVRLSRFEKAVPEADALTTLYPGDAACASDALTLHRSLSGLDPKHAELAERVVSAALPAQEEPLPLLVSLGEMWQDLDRSEPAGRAWRRALDLSPRDPARVLEIATAFWDYGRMGEALEVIEAARKRLDRPRLHAFEAGVLREEARDLPGALREYLDTVRGEHSGHEGTDWYALDWRAQTRLATLMGRRRPLQELLARVEALRPGVPADEESLLPFLRLLSGGSGPDDGEADDWEAAPDDPVGRQQRAEVRRAAAPSEQKGIVVLGSRVFGKTKEMLAKASGPSFLVALRQSRSALLDRRWAPDSAEDVAFDAALLSREAELLPGEEERIAKGLERARFLLGHERAAEARTAARALRTRIEALPDEGTRIRHVVELARFLEDAGEDVRPLWSEVSARYPWSLGLLEDRVAFELRSERAAEALALLEDASKRAAPGHRQNLTERLARESLTAGDLVRARRALTALLSFELPEERRVTASGLLARLSFRDEPGFDAYAFAKGQAAKLSEPARADLWSAVATAGREEGKLDAALTCAIEGLNLRLDRTLLHEACRIAVGGGTEAKLLGFFEAQRKRSPRDVRWAVAVREIRMFGGDLPGAIAAAKEACAVAPEKENLQRETVDLILRTLKPAEAADFLAGWASTRKGDEGVASWRSSLYLKAGDDAKAIAVERESLDAWKKEVAESRTADDVRSEAKERLARVARRFLSANRAAAAWTIAAPGGDAKRALEVPLSHGERMEIALRSGNHLKLLAAFEGNADFRQEAAGPIERVARFDQLDEIQEWLLGRLFPAGAPPSEAALERWWDVASSSGFSRLGEAVSRRLLETKGETGAPATDALLKTLEPVRRIEPKNAPARYVFSTDRFQQAIVAYLVSRDRKAELGRVLAPLVDELNARVASPAPPDTALPFAGWFPVAAFAELAATPERAAWRDSAAGWLGSTAAWTRFRNATGGRWDVRPLLSLLSEAERNAFLERSAAAAADPSLAPRIAAQTRAATALAALVAGKPDALVNPDLIRLRGPRSVGDVLGKDPRFTWSELPALGESGDDAVAGGGVDAGRLPGRLWGVRPGTPWYVLETLARWREKDVTAALVPSESTARGDETARTLAAVRTAQGLGDATLALALDERYAADLGKRERLGRRLRLLVETGGVEKADALFTAEIRKLQATAGEEAFQAWSAVATELKLAAPQTRVDPGSPLSPMVAVLLIERLGPESGSRFKPTDVSQLRSILASRWAGDPSLSPDRTTYLLEQLWAEGVSAYPVAADRLGPWWPRAKEFLVGLPESSRREGLNAVRALPDATRLAAIAAGGDRREATEVLLLRAELANGKDAEALTRLAGLLAARDGKRTLRFTPPARVATEEPAEGEEPAPAAPPADTADASSIGGWLRVFRETRRAEVVGKAEALLKPRVARDLAQPFVPLASWLLALDLATAPDETRRVVDELERSWARGDWAFDPDKVQLIRALARKDPAAAARWTERLEEATTPEAVESRVAMLVARKLHDEARREWTLAAGRLGLSKADQLRAFDGWRRVPGAPGVDAPAAWRLAAEFWRRKGSELPAWGTTLAAHLRKHPYDRLSARVVLRSLAPASEDVAGPAAAALDDREDVPAWRMARSEVARSPRAARSLFPSSWIDVGNLVRRHFPRAEVDGLLADVSRAYAACGDASFQRALGALEERTPATPQQAALRAELEAQFRKTQTRPEVVRLVDGAIRPLLPRDLTWDLYSRLLTLEDVP